MIKFFRQVRKSLFSKNKSSQYFKYAIGEIILVVIGILIAIGLNDRNSKRNEKLLVSQKLEQLRLEVHRDSLEFAQFIELYEENKKTAIRLISNLNSKNDTIDCKKMIDDIIEIETIRTFLVKNSSYNEMLNEGLFSKIENKNLKQQIDNYYKFQDTFEKAIWDYLAELRVIRNHLINNNIILLKHHRIILEENENPCQYKDYLTLNAEHKKAFENYVYKILETKKEIQQFYIILNKYIITGIPVKSKN